jgi:hypothetical protein
MSLNGTGTVYCIANENTIWKASGALLGLSNLSRQHARQTILFLISSDNIVFSVYWIVLLSVVCSELLLPKHVTFSDSYFFSSVLLIFFRFGPL